MISRVSRFVRGVVERTKRCCVDASRLLPETPMQQQRVPSTSSQGMEAESCSVLQPWKRYACKRCLVSSKAVQCPVDKSTMQE
mmetsp:Transcript_29507/g.78039  ORF Transcript_29507/g.78039 Transcript_29507/m.78039 type:complete len:83 (-) Transcript_29507:273-521(-)